MSELDREAITARVNAATEGPWVGVIKPNGKGVGIVGVEARRGQGAQGAIAVIQSLPGGAERRANVEFIAHARTDVPALLAAWDDEHARADAAEAESVRLREALDAAVELLRELASDESAGEDAYTESLRAARAFLASVSGDHHP